MPDEWLDRERFLEIYAYNRRPDRCVAQRQTDGRRRSRHASPAEVISAVAPPFPGVGDRRLAAVTDPAPFDHQTQHFEYLSAAPGILETRYTDRRGEVWQVPFDEQSGNLLSRTDPPGHTQQLAYDDPRPQFAHDRTASPLGSAFIGVFTDYWTPHQLGETMKSEPPGRLVRYEVVHAMITRKWGIPLQPTRCFLGGNYGHITDCIVSASLAFYSI